MDSAPTLDNYEGDALGLFGNVDENIPEINDKFSNNNGLFNRSSVGIEECSRMCYASSG